MVFSFPLLLFDAPFLRPLYAKLKCHFIKCIPKAFVCSGGVRPSSAACIIDSLLLRNTSQDIWFFCSQPFNVGSLLAFGVGQHKTTSKWLPVLKTADINFTSAVKNYWQIDSLSPNWLVNETDPLKDCCHASVLTIHTSLGCTQTDLQHCDKNQNSEVCSCQR